MRTEKSVNLPYEAKAVVFDLDNTLISESHYVKSGFRHVARIVASRSAFSEENVFNTLQMVVDHRFYFREGPDLAIRRMLNALGMPSGDQEVEELANAYWCHIPEIDFYEDVKPCLKTLKRMGIKTGIITEGCLASQQKKLFALKASDYFDCIIAEETLGQAFENSREAAFTSMKEALGVEFEEMVYVADNPEKDFYIGSVCPIQTVRILRDDLPQSQSYWGGIKEHHRIRQLDEIFRGL